MILTSRLCGRDPGHDGAQASHQPADLYQAQRPLGRRGRIQRIWWCGYQDRLCYASWSPSKMLGRLNWGCSGPDCDRLAYALLADALGELPAARHYKALASEILATLPDRWGITRRGLMIWVSERERKGVGPC